MKLRYRQPYSWPSISKVCDHRYRIIRPSISITFDIDIRYRRCKTSISNEHLISKSSISNVPLDIEGPTLDIGVARIQMFTVTGMICNGCNSSRQHAICCKVHVMQCYYMVNIMPRFITWLITSCLDPLHDRLHPEWMCRPAGATSARGKQSFFGWIQFARHYSSVQRSDLQHTDDSEVAAAASARPARGPCKKRD
jgi:hypothetical protein